VATSELAKPRKNARLATTENKITHNMIYLALDAIVTMVIIGVCSLKGSLTTAHEVVCSFVGWIGKVLGVQNQYEGEGPFIDR
jgi:hypothetical protein